MTSTMQPKKMTPDTDGPAAAGWQPMATAPRDGTNILLYTTQGIVDAWFSPGEWSEHHETGREYSGDCWVCYDDAIQIEVETLGEDYHDGQATHWMPRPPDPGGSAHVRGSS